MTGILMICGSLRAGSSNLAVLRTAAARDPRCGVYRGMAELPLMNPDDDRDPLPEPVRALRAAIAAADALLFCTPEYAGSLPGSLKNLLDWTVGGGEMYGKRVGWINAAAPLGRAGGAHDTLRVVLGYAGTEIVERACVALPVARETIGADGLVADPDLVAGIAAVVTTLLT